jgi:hypothetical protein
MTKPGFNFSQFPLAIKSGQGDRPKRLDDAAKE